MSVPQIVFILGAGASAEAHFPVGSELTTKIGSLLDIRFGNDGKWISGDRLIIEALRLRALIRRTSPGDDFNVSRHAAQRIRQAMPLAASIDTFLDAHRDDKHVDLCGKLAIVRSILQEERDSPLYGDLATGPDPLISLEGVRGSWLNAFWQVLCDGCTAEQVAERARSVVFVSFNYDRCIEQFLYQAARAYYDLRPAVAAESVSNIRVLHPYGSIGALPWQIPASRSAAIAYGSDISAQPLLDLTSGIRTFTETTSHHDETVDEIRACVRTAPRVVFLGFAFHYQNLRLLWPGVTTGRTGDRHFYGTAFQISDADVRAIKAEISNYAGPYAQDIVLRNDLRCAALFQEYRQSLSMLGRR